MKKTFQIEGMHCNSCVAKVKNKLEEIPEISSVEVLLSEKLAHIHINDNKLNLGIVDEQLRALGYSAQLIEEQKSEAPIEANIQERAESFKPLILIVGYLLLGCTIFIYNTTATLESVMNIFMGGFFIVFSFFKMLDIQGFARSFAMYDPIAKRSSWYALSYPFIELLLGVAFWTGIHPTITNMITFLIMTIGLAGVIEAVLNSKKIQCACLGTVFNLPMTTVTIVESSVMSIMALYMIVYHLN